jgi:hypothetical protein
MKHKHKWTKPYMMSTVGMVKACRAKGYCPKRMKAVPPKHVQLAGRR